jgi:SAM-dependent methyltransferase
LAVDAEADWRRLNQANWDDRVPVHLASAFYDVEGFKARYPAGSLPSFQLDEVGDVDGKRLVHLQCHIGLDTLSWAARGALVTGVDFSIPAVEAATALASSLGVTTAAFVVSDVYQAAETLSGETFDVVYTGTGALCWLPSITRWASVVSSLLRPGGFVYIAESHPVIQTYSDDGTAIEFDYFEPGPLLFDYPDTYTDGPALQHTRTVEFQHPLGSIVTALASEGLRIEFLHEFDFESFQRFPSLVQCDDGMYRYPAGQPRLPMTFSLRASKPAAQVR